MIDQRTLLNLYEISRLREQGWTNAKIARHLDMTTQNLYALKKRHRGFSQNVLVDQLLTHNSSDLNLNKLLREAAVHILRLQEALGNTIELPKRIALAKV